MKEWMRFKWIFGDHEVQPPLLKVVKIGTGVCVSAQDLIKLGFQPLQLETPQPLWHLRQFSVLWDIGFLEDVLAGNNRSKGDSEYLGLFCIFSQQIPCWFSHGALAFLLLFLQKPMNHSRTFLILLLALILLTGILWSTLSWSLQLCLPWPWHN